MIDQTIIHSYKTNSRVNLGLAISSRLRGLTRIDPKLLLSEGYLCNFISIPLFISSYSLFYSLMYLTFLFSFLSFEF